MSASLHTPHTCNAIGVSCMDFRLRTFLRAWTQKEITGGFDRVALGGGVKNLPFILEQIELSVKLHHICTVYLINHEDCGAYAEEGTFARHKKDLLFAKKIIRQRLPQLVITPLFLTLDGKFLDVGKKKS